MCCQGAMRRLWGMDVVTFQDVAVNFSQGLWALPGLFQKTIDRDGCWECAGTSLLWETEGTLVVFLFL